LDLGLPPDPKNLEPAITFMLKAKLDHPEIIMVIFSTIANMELPNVSAALNSSVSYIVKEDIKKGEDLYNILSVACEGCAVYSQAPAATFAEIFHDNSSNVFTTREAQVAGLIHQGLTNRQIASNLKISEYTARDLVSKVYRKSDTAGRAEFAAWYERNKLMK
jgi:non-specific serine/threonine protein kinase